MVCRNISDLDELDKVECWESETVVPAGGIFDEIKVNWSAVNLLSLGPVNLDVLGETIKPVVNSLSNS